MIQAIETFIQNYGSWGFFLGILLEEIIVPLPSSLIMMAGGFFLITAKTWQEAISQIFPGLVLVGALGVSFGSLFFYFLSYYGGELAVKKFGSKLGFSFGEAEKIQKHFQKNYLDEAILLVLRALPIFPGVAINVVAGLIKMPLLNFIVFGFLGSCLRVFLMAFLGWQLKGAYATLAWQLERVNAVVFLIFIVISAILFLSYLKKKNEKNHQKSN
ncbi:MAG: VTT domain-containing protein [Patescibacteria group bacterium]